MPRPSLLLAGCVTLAFTSLTLGRVRAETTPPLELEGTIGSRAAWLQLRFDGRQIVGSYGSGSPRIGPVFEAELPTTPPDDGLMSCGWTVADSSTAKAREFSGICDFSVLDGVRDVAFHGQVHALDGRNSEPVAFVTRRSRSLATQARYGGMLPVPALPASLAVPANCSGTPSIQGVVRDGKRSFVLHALRFDCAMTGEYGLPFQTFALNLSVVDDSGARPVLEETLSLPIPFLDAEDVVDWSAGMTPFRLAKEVVGLAITAGGTVSGSGVLTTVDEHVLAVPADGVPRKLLTFQASNFGKSSIEDYSWENADLLQVEVDGAEPPELLVTRSGTWVTAGVERDHSEPTLVYRFLPSTTQLVEWKGRSVSARAWGRAKSIAGAQLLADAPP